MKKVTLTEALQVLSALNRLKTMNIVVTEFGDVVHKYYNHEDMGYAYKALVEHKRKGNPFSSGPTMKEVCTLALAEYQEECNRFIDQDEIDFVNQFFGGFQEAGPITNDDVQAFNRKYI